MLYEFLTAQRAELIERCRLKVAGRRAPQATDVELEHGIPLFIDQLIKTLRVEQTSDMVHQTVISPVRQLSGLLQGITVGLEFLFGGRGRRNGGSREERRPVPQDEMFI